MGRKRDLIGDPAKAASKQGIKFVVSNHRRMERWTFIHPRLDIQTDLMDPKYATFYGPPQKPGT